MKSSVPYLLISDLDDTLLGDDQALRRFHDFYQAECVDMLGLIYASGRFADSIRNDVLTTDLPEPLYIIGGVGSEIRRFEDDSGVAEWEEQISENWSAETVRETLADMDTIKLQPEENQSPFKVSYLYPNATPDHLDEIRERLSAAGLNINLIYSSRRDLDVLPGGVDKGTAAEFIAHHLGVLNGQVLTSGNSGNDITLMEHEFHGIVVANAHDDLRECADGNHRIHQSTREYADGVRDGVRYWLNRLESQHDE